MVTEADIERSRQPWPGAAELQRHKLCIVIAAAAWDSMWLWFQLELPRHEVNLSWTYLCCNEFNAGSTLEGNLPLWTIGEASSFRTPGLSDLFSAQMLMECEAQTKS